MAKKSPGAGRAGNPLPAASQADDGAHGVTRPIKPAKPSAVLNTRVVYCGDNLEQLAKLPDACNSAFRTPHSAIAVAGSFYYHCDWHASQGVWLAVSESRLAFKKRKC